MTAKCAVCQIHAESVFKIEGMDCHEEVAILERTLKRLTGLEALDADVMAQRLRVKHDAAILSPTRIAEAVARTGMRAWLEHESAVQPSAATGTRTRLVVISGVLLAAGLLARAIPALAGFAWLPFAAAVVLAGIHPARRAWVSMRSRVLDINVLMVVAVCGAVALGEWSEGGLGRFPVRAGAAARNAGHGAGAGGDPRADGPCAGGSGGSSRRCRRARAGRRRARRRADRRQARRKDSARRGRSRRRESRQRVAGHRRVAAGGEGTRRRGVRRHHQRSRRAPGRR